MSFFINTYSTAAAISSEVKVSEDHCLNDELMKPLYDELRERSLSTSCPAKVQGYELRILNQPEEQHRARYMTEGSRGAIKDRTQKDHPRVKVIVKFCIDSFVEPVLYYSVINIF